jgi:hypothetical protein
VIGDRLEVSDQVRRRLEFERPARPIPLPTQPRQEEQEHRLEDVGRLGAIRIAAGHGLRPSQPPDQQRSIDRPAQGAPIALDQQPDRFAIVVLKPLNQLRKAWLGRYFRTHTTDPLRRGHHQAFRQAIIPDASPYDTVACRVSEWNYHACNRLE